MALATKQFEVRPEMIVQIASDYNGNGRRLQWGFAPSYPSSTFPDAKFYGRYACFPLKVDDGELRVGEKIEEKEEGEDMLQVPRRLMERIHEAFISGIATNETHQELRDILDDK